MQTETIANESGTEWLNKAEIAQHFRCSVRHINKLMRRRILPFLKIGRFVRFDRAACDSAIKAYETKSLFG
jgi:excisionase family DNA binding protein